ncbi:MAG: CapA family protein [Candidatus Doudnabacteria bacterium]|nr:CapA family protein [Candidatus Doudnabacteria bacterium]
MIRNRKALIPIIILVAALAVVFYFIAPKFFIPGKPIKKVSNVAQDSLQSYYEQAQNLNSHITPTTTATFLAVGDIMLSRNVALAINNANDAGLPFKNMADVLRSTDFNFANLESPAAPIRPVIGGHSLVFGAATSSLQALKDFNFQIINSANNHAFDQGLAGLEITNSTLDSLGIAHEGTGDNLDQAWGPAVVTANGIKICFVGASYGTNGGGSLAAQYVAEIAETDRLNQAITKAKSECDFTVATMHAGIEYTRIPNAGQKDFAHAAIDDGADMVIGAHPHWVQPFEKYQGKYIFYSLGNFIFDQGFSQDTSQGLTLKITVSKTLTTNPTTPGAATADDLQGTRKPAQLDSVELLPVIITNSQPRPATPAETKTILSKIKQQETILK